MHWQFIKSWLEEIAQDLNPASSTSSNLVPRWYHFLMAMNLRLSETQSVALRKVAAQQGISMQDAALAAIDRPQPRFGRWQ